MKIPRVFRSCCKSTCRNKLHGQKLHRECSALGVKSLLELGDQQICTNQGHWFRFYLKSLAPKDELPQTTRQKSPSFLTLGSLGSMKSENTDVGHTGSTLSYTLRHSQPQKGLWTIHQQGVWSLVVSASKHGFWIYLGMCLYRTCKYCYINTSLQAGFGEK